MVVMSCIVGVGPVAEILRISSKSVASPPTPPTITPTSLTLRSHAIVFNMPWMMEMPLYLIGLVMCSIMMLQALLQIVI